MSGADHNRIAAQFAVTDNADYRVLLYDTEQMTNAHRAPKRYRVQALPDAAPEISIEEPSGDRQVTPTASIPIRALVKDDFGVGSVDLCYRRADNTSGSGNDQVQETQLPLFRSDASPQRALVEHNWALASLKLKPGALIRFHATACDLRDQPGPNLARSREIRLFIVTKEEFLRQLETQQQLLREEVQRVLQLQRNALAEVTDLNEQARVQDLLDREQTEKLETAELLQRRIREKVSDSAQSLQDRTAELLRSLRDNQVEDVETSKRLVLIDSELARIAEQHLPPVAQSLTRARKLAEQTRPISTAGQSRDRLPQAPPDRAGDSPLEKAQAKQTAPARTKPKAEQVPDSSPKKPADQTQPDSPLVQELTNASNHQRQVAESLAQMLKQLEKWETVPQLTNEARDVQRRQGEVNDRVEKLSAKTLGRQLSDLQAQEQAELGKTAARQEDNREQLQSLQEKIGRLAQRFAKEDPLTAEMLREALRQSEKANTTGRMTETARAIRENKMGAASRQQREVSQALAELIETLENRRERELARLVKQLRAAEQDLQRLREEHRQLRKQTSQARNRTDQAQREQELRRLQKRQRQLQQQTEEFARRLSRLSAAQASLRSGRAGERMARAAEQLQQGQGQGAQEQQRQADEELEEAQQQLARVRQQAEQELAREQLAKTVDAIRQVHQRQLALKEDVVRLETLRSDRGRWSRGELQSVRSVARTQGGLAAETEGLGEKLSQQKVFLMVIHEAAKSMSQAAKLLEKRQAGQTTQRAINVALHKLTQLRNALQPPDRPQQQAQQAGDGEGGGQGGDGGDGIPDIAQIMLLKALQTEINEATAELAQRRDHQKKPTPEQAKELERRFVALSERQGQLADLIRDLTASRPQPDEIQGEQP